MYKKKILLIMVLSTLSLSHLYAGCGGCGPRKKTVAKPAVSTEVLTTVPYNKAILGSVEASCGLCNFGTNDRDCSLAIRIGEEVFAVAGSGIDDHGDSHAKDGFCNAIRVANVDGRIYRNKFYSDTFTLKE